MSTYAFNNIQNDTFIMMPHCDGIFLMEGGFWVISFLFYGLFVLPKMNVYLYNKEKLVQ